jgi:uncharacterized membrane protein YdjX (TVP38/TMEM64 family)
LKTGTKVIIGVIVIALVAAATALLWPFMKELSDPVYQAQFKAWISALGVWGVLVLFGLQIVQIVIAFIPGGPVEVISGMLYGTWGGALICLVGCAVATSLVFTISRRFGKPLLYKFFGKEKIDNLAFLQDSKKIETVAFVLFLIPGTPKDMLTYISGVSGISLPKFLIITLIARAPATLVSAMAGESMMQGQWAVTITIFVVAAIIGLLGIRYGDRVMNYCRNLGR